MGIKVLVVDDSMMIRAQVARTLRQADFSVVEAVDGVDALQKLAEGDFALVVCDVNMPNMNGIELLEAMRERASLAKLSVVMLTTEGQAEMITRAKALGAKGWLMKPFKPELLVAAAKKLTTLAA